MQGRARRSFVLAATAALVAGLGVQGTASARGAGDGGVAAPVGPQVRLDEIQVLASHNSYHVEPEPVLLDALKAFLGPAAGGFEYTHRPLHDELDAGVRQIELDVFVDDAGGGRFAQPKLDPVLGLDPVDPRMSDPGLKVLHVQEVDYRSTCPTFVDCLTQVRDWSDAHAGHLPLVIQIEAKDGAIPDPGFDFVQPLPWTDDAFAQLEDEIASVFPPERVLTPGEVKGSFPSLAQAVTTRGWPMLREARGQVMFTLDDKGAKRDTYRALLPDIEQRSIFVDVPETDPDAAVMVVNDPIAQADRIRSLVDQGFLVRTRADVETAQARTGDTTMRDAALASGAHFVSTDYVFPDPRFGTGYVVDLPGDQAARCNPVSARANCARADLAG